MRNDLDDLVRQLNAPSFDEARFINNILDTSKPIKDQYLQSARLTTQVNQHSQTLLAELSERLQALQRSEKRVPHEINLLKNDVHAANTALNEQYGPISALTHASRRSPALNQLDELQVVREQMLAVQSLLHKVSEPATNKSAAEMAEMAAVLAGTPGEAKWRSQTQSYYNLINKIIS